MKLLNTWFALILIASASSLNVAKLGSVNAQSALPSPRNEQQRQSADQPSDTSNSTPAPTTPKPSLTVSIPAPQTPAPQGHPEKWGQRFYRHIWPPLWSTFFPPVWSNWALVIAAGVAAGIAIRTLIEIRRSNLTAIQVARATRVAAIATEQYVKLTEDMAKAAKQSVAAIQAQLEFTKIANEQNVKIAAQGAEAAKQSAQIARLALDVERPYIFIESHNISTRNIKGGSGRESAALLLTTNEVEEEADANYKQISLSFGLRNRGRGVAIIQAVKLRLIEMPSFRRLGTTGLAGMVPVQQGKFGIVARQTLITTQSVIGSGEVSFYETFGMAIPIDDWRRLRANGLPAIVVRAGYIDTTEMRRFRALQRFTWLIDSDLLLSRPKLPRRRRRPRR